MDKDILRKVQLVQLEIAKEIKRICEKNDIKYFLDSGTLLGAVRHKGFIPWDDDLDIGMTRENYEKFIKACELDLSDKYILQSRENDKYFGVPFIKIRKKNTKLIEQASDRQRLNGIWVDIFPYDVYPDDEESRIIQGKKIERIRKLMWMKSKIKIWSSAKSKKEYLKIRLRFLPTQIISLFISRNYLIKKYDEIAVQYNESNSEYYFPQPGASLYGQWLVPSECLNELILLEFENEKFLAPKNYDLYLTKVYGDYMQLPPEDSRYNRHGIIEVDFGE